MRVCLTQGGSSTRSIFNTFRSFGVVRSRGHACRRSYKRYVFNSSLFDWRMFLFGHAPTVRYSAVEDVHYTFVFGHTSTIWDSAVEGMILSPSHPDMQDPSTEELPKMFTVPFVFHYISHVVSIPSLV